VGFINLLLLVLVNDSIIVETFLLSGNLGFPFNMVAYLSADEIFQTVEVTYYASRACRRD